jgi:hypothetical protein
MRRRGQIVAGIAVCGALFVAVPAGAQEAAPVQGAQEASEEGGSGAPNSAAGQPEVVKVGALINDIQQLDLQTKSYAVDLYLWFKWDNPEIDPSRTFEFLNPFQLWGHIRQYAGVKPERLKDGTYYSSLHVQGQFNSNLAIDDYPFDDQKLIVAIEDKSKDESELVYVPDDVDPIAVSPDISIPGWEIEDPFMDVISNQYPTTFGEPEVSAATYSRAIFGLEVTRPAGTYSLKLLLPMLLVALTAALALSVHPQYVEGRIGIGITALLTLVALQLTSDSGLPDVNNLILLDKLYILSYVFVVLTMAVIVKNSWVDATGDIGAATRADRRGLILLTGGYVAAAGLILVINLA